MDDSLEQSLSEISHHVSCLCTSAGVQLDDIFRLNHLLPYSKFANDIRGICINLSNYFSAHVPLLDSFVIAPVNSTPVDGAIPPNNKQLVADLLNISRGDDILNYWGDLRLEYLNTGADLVDNSLILSLVESHNELLQEVVNRSADFEKPMKLPEADTTISSSLRKEGPNKELENYLAAIS